MTNISTQLGKDFSTKSELLWEAVSYPGGVQVLGKMVRSLPLKLTEL